MESWQPLTAAASSRAATVGSTEAPAAAADSTPCVAAGDGRSAAPVYVAAFLAGPVRSLLTPSVHRTMQHVFWDRVGGTRVLFARLFDVHTLSSAQHERLRCVLQQIAGSGGGEWSAPQVAGKSFLPNSSALSRCQFSAGTQLQQYPYMVQSLQRQLSTLRACFDRMLAYETERQLRFRWILRTRTDTAFLLPARPFCELQESTVYHGRNFTKGEDVHHMFADHCAVVPRNLASSMFVSIGERLADCARHGERMPPSFSTPEAFIHHALRAMQIGSRSVPWLAPIVVSTDGRMQKWCGRYGKLHVREIGALGATSAECEHALLVQDGKWVQVASAGLKARHAETLRVEHCTSSQSRGAAATRAPMACTWSNGCCARHPRHASCARGQHEAAHKI